MSTQHQGVTLLGNTIPSLKEAHGLGGGEDNIGVYIDALIEDYDMQVFDIETHGHEAIGYTLPTEMSISLSSVNKILKLSKKFEEATGCTAKVLSCIFSY